MIDGAGHYPHAEMPDRTAGALLPFLTATTSPPTTRHRNSRTPITQH